MLKAADVNEMVIEWKAHEAVISEFGQIQLSTRLFVQAFNLYHF